MTRIFRPTICQGGSEELNIPSKPNNNITYQTCDKRLCRDCAFNSDLYDFSYRHKYWLNLLKVKVIDED